MPMSYLDDFSFDLNQQLNILYQEAYPKVKSYILQNKGNEQDAEDIFSESCVTLVNNIRSKKFKGDSSLSTYLFGICKYSWLNQLRKKKIEISDNENQFLTLSSEYTNDEVDEQEEKDEQIDAIMEALETLADECKEMLKRYYFYKEKLKDIAKTMGYTDQFARVKKNRCMNGLRNKVLKH